MRVANWNPKAFDEEIYGHAMERLQSAADVLIEATKAKLNSVIRHSISRPAYKTGAYAGKTWTAREAGALIKTVRAVRKNDNSRNIRVIVGNYNVYYAHAFEYSLTKGKPYFRPAIRSSKDAMKNAFEGGA